MVTAQMLTETCTLC